MAEKQTHQITSRLKDLIIRGGENIHPLEIENCLFAHPRVAAASVVGLPDERYGECVAAFVVATTSTAGGGGGGGGVTVAEKPLTEDEVKGWVRERLGHWLVPKYVFWTEGFPKTESGKVKKFRLREEGIRRLRDGEG